MIGNRVLMTLMGVEVLLFIKIYGDAAGLTNNHMSKLTEHFVQHGVDCLASNTLSPDDVRALQMFNVPKGRQSACFFACVLRKTEMIDAEGKISTGKVLDVAKNVFDSEEELKAAVSAFQHCEYVNDLEVNDGTEGCDRAKYFLTCIMDECKRDNKMSNGELTALSDTDAKFGLRNIVQSVLEGFLRLACLGLSKDFLPGRIIAKLLPGLETDKVPKRFQNSSRTIQKVNWCNVESNLGLELEDSRYTFHTILSIQRTPKFYRGKLNRINL